MPSTFELNLHTLVLIGYALATASALGAEEAASEEKEPAPAEKPQQLPEVTVTGAPPDTTDYKTTRATTATKTDTPIFDLPVSIQVVPRELMDDRQVILLQEALENVSGVVPNFGGGNLNDSALIRGFFVNAYRDGFRGRSSSRLATSTSDLERVDVLKGPASVLYGRIELGGFINQISKQPLATPYRGFSQPHNSC